MLKVACRSSLPCLLSIRNEGPPKSANMKKDQWRFELATIISSGNALTTFHSQSDLNDESQVELGRPHAGMPTLPCGLSTNGISM
jgi:hypothetical protein